MKKNSGKKLMTIICLLAVLTGCTACGQTKDSLNITLTEAAQIEVSEYKDPEGRFTVSIPEGWEVEASPMADMSFAIHIYKPDEESPKYHIYSQLKLELMLSPEMKAFEVKTFGSFPVYAMLYDAPVNEDGTVAGMYSSFNDIMTYMRKYETGYDSFYLPWLNNFEVLEEYEYNSLMHDYASDDKILRGTYTDVYDDSLQQGLFTGSIVQSPLGTGTYSAYNINFISAPDEEFTLYEPVLAYIFSTISYSDDWVNQIMQNTENSYATAREIGESLAATYESCNQAWEARNNTYDIISQKQSDATMGYERVVDTNTGEIYRAYSGFTDEYKGKDLVLISDDMYTLPYVGYIER